MPERMKMVHEPEYLHVVLEGLFDLQKAIKFYDAIITECLERGKSKVLIDARKLEGEIPILDRYEFGKHMASFREQPIKIAFVGTKEQVLPDRFLENVASNLGVITFVTTEVEKAERWFGETGQATESDAP